MGISSLQQINTLFFGGSKTLIERKFRRFVHEAFEISFTFLYKRQTFRRLKKINNGVSENKQSMMTWKAVVRK